MKTRDRARRGCWIPLIVLLGCLPFCRPDTAGAGDAAASRKLLKDISAACADIGRETIPAVVFIKVEKSVDANALAEGGIPYFNNPFDLFGDESMRRFFRQGPGGAPQPNRFKIEGAGSGFLISEDGYILSNYHVVGDADRITVRLNDGREFKAKKIGADPKSEVAVIKIEGKGFPFLRLGDSHAMAAGEWVIAVGNPFGLSETLTVGVVSAKGRSNIGIADYEDFIQTDAAINPGNSGGPLLNVDGEVVGINTAIFSQNGGYMGIGFAIPINMAKDIKEQLIKTGKVVRGYLGVSVQSLTADIAGSFGFNDTKGALVAGVTAGSPAEKAGLKQGDIILNLNGNPVKDAGGFRISVGAIAPNTNIKLGIYRDGKETTVSATTGVQPEESGAGAGAEPAGAVALGFTVTELTRDLAERYGYAVDEGVIVDQIEMNGPAARAGLQPGCLITSVNHVPVKNVDDFNKNMAKADKSKGVLFNVKDTRGSSFMVIRPD